MTASREAAAALKAQSLDVRYTELSGVDHNAWDVAYASKEFTGWLFSQHRQHRASASLHGRDG